MGGAIGVVSRPGVGSCFRFTVPLVADLRAPLIGADAPDLHGRSIVLVSASAAAPTLAEGLQRWGASVQVVADATDARTLLQGRESDVLIVDRSTANGAASELAAATARTRIVLLSPQERSELPSLGAAGFTGYLIKPVRRASLRALLAADAAGNAPSLPPITPAAMAPGHSRSAAPLKILVAEDNDINALLACSLLEKLGHRPVLAIDGMRAVEAWESARDADAAFDLVFMDVQMPEMDGLEATRRIRDAEAGGDARTPIVALSANAFPEDREACLAAGMDGFLVKPLDRERLAAWLERPSLAA
jgi:CheY-like chemotaxis protein